MWKLLSMVLRRTGIVLDGPLGENLGYRLSVSSYETDGMYDNSNVPGQKLGAQSTDDTALTLVFEPSDKFKVKLRYHTWEDSDGPDAGTAYDYRSGTHNCSPGGLVERWDPVQVQASAAYNLTLQPMSHTQQFVEKFLCLHRLAKIQALQEH